MSHSSRFIHQESRSLENLFQELRACAPLLRDDEQRLAQILSDSPRDANGMPTTQEAREAIDTLIRANIRLAIRTADKYTKMSRGRVTADDASSCALIGLIKAATMYRPLGFKFYTYAESCIMSELRKMMITTLMPVKYGGDTYRWATPVARYINDRYNGDRHRVDIAQMAEDLGITRYKAQAAFDYLAPERRLDSEKSANHKGPHGETYKDFLTYDDQEMPDSCATDLDRKRLVEALMDGMAPAQRRALERVYYDGMPPAQAAREEGVSRQAIDYRLAKAMKYMRKQHKRLEERGVLA